MNQQYFDFFDDQLVKVIGNGGRTSDQYTQMFDHFKTQTPERDPDLVIEETTEDVDPDIVLGAPGDYGWTGEAFVVRGRRGVMAIKPGWTHIKVTPGFDPFYAIYPMEFEIRRQMVEDNRAIVHAAGARLEGQTTLFPAWRSAGKTNTLLSLLRKGADYLSDDRLWVGADGSAMGYPLGVNLQSHNIESFPELELEHESVPAQIRHEVHESIDKRFTRPGTLPEKAIAYLNDALLDDNRRNFIDISSEYPTAAHVEESTVDNVVFLEAAPNARTVAAEPISTDEAMAAVTAISNFEWDGRLREYFHAYDTLVGAGDRVKMLDEVIRQEWVAFRDLFEAVGTYRARVPREQDWNEHGLDSEVVEMVTSMGTSAAAGAR